MVQFSRPKKSLAAAMDPFKRRETSAAEFLSKSEFFFFVFRQDGILKMNPWQMSAMDMDKDNHPPRAVSTLRITAPITHFHLSRLMPSRLSAKH